MSQTLLQDTTIYNLLKDFLTPILLAGFGLYFSYFLNNKTSREKQELQDKKRITNLFDTFILGLDKIDTVFESLKLDAEKKTYFEYTNISIAKPTLYRLQNIANEVALATSDKLRRTLLKNVDGLTSVIEDVDNLEAYLNRKEQDFDSESEQLLEKLRQMKLDLLKQDIELDDKSQPVYVGSSKKPSETKLNAVRKLYDTLNAKYLQAEKKRDDARQFCKDKRVFYAMRIVDLQTKLRELRSQLVDERNKYTPPINDE